MERCFAIRCSVVIQLYSRRIVVAYSESLDGSGVHRQQRLTTFCARLIMIALEGDDFALTDMSCLDKTY